MQKTLIFLALALAVASAANWKLVWSDEFKGKSLDMGKWKHDLGASGWGNNEMEDYTNSHKNAYIKNGHLVIQANKEGNHITSARINTAGKFSTLYGRVEMRAKLPHGQGIWPAFWMLGDNIGKVGWPACGEIDIMEFVGKDPNHSHASLHAPGFDTHDMVASSSPSAFSNGFHTYGVIWDKDNFQFYVDGKIFKKINRHSSHAKSWPFNDHKFFILLNLAVGGNWPGAPNASTRFPQQFIIDYVRVYKRA